MMTRLMKDITDFIFISDEASRSDVIFLPGGSDSAISEKAAELFKKGFAPIWLPSGGVSVKTGKFGGVKRKREI